MNNNNIDGNDSVSSIDTSVCDDDQSNAPNYIPVHTGYRPVSNHSNIRPPPVRKTIRRDNKVLQAVTLPRISSYNMRSLMPKLNSFSIDMLDRNTDLSFLTEIWQKAENKRHQFKIEELYEMKGLKYISTPRPGNRRGGGAALVVNTERFSISKLNISQPKSLEIVWGLMKPREVTGRIKSIIACCFYCPPKSKKKTALIDHMTLTLQSLLNTFPNAAVLISGDRNDLSIARLLSVDRSLRQIVQKGTRGPNVLTIVCTDLELFYQEPEIVPPVDVDIPGKGVPSDHCGVVVIPLDVADVPPKRQKYVRTVRPITSSAINNIGQVLTNEQWLFMDPQLDPTSLTDLFEYYTGGVVDTFCPERSIFARPNDLPWITENLKVLKRKISREYEKRGKSQKYTDLKFTFQLKLENEAAKYKEKICEEVRSGNRNSAYSALRKLGVRPGDVTSNTFTLPSHSDANLSAEQSAEIIADHFAAISQQYEPISLENFPPVMKNYLNNPDVSDVPVLEEYQVYKRICKAKKPTSTVPGDLPKRIVQEFSCELAAPVTVIYKAILKTFQYPRQWVVEQQVPLPKVYPPSSLDDLRNIAKTAFFSKCFESFLSDWLLPIVGPYLDPCQYGLKGASINHYLFKLLKFIHQYLDLKNPHAVVVALIDLSKAFNRVSHQMVLEDLYDMHVPAWLLLILSSYLSNRSMVLCYKGATSSPRDLPGSSPQGAFLGIFFFIIKYNGASLRPHIPRLLASNECIAKRKNCKAESCVKHSKDMHALYIDDLSEAEAVELKRQLFNDPIQRPYPLNYHERTKHIFPAKSSLLQKRLLKVEDFTMQNHMKINEAKSKVMIFNKSRNFDFPPEFAFQNNEMLEVLEETRLLGLILTTDLRWQANTKSICIKTMSKMWLLRRMKVMKMEPELIFDYYLKEIRVLAEQSVPIWNSGLTKLQVNELEKIQKVALRIILGDDYLSYDAACTKFNIKTLSVRRLELCTNYAIKLYKSDTSCDFFNHMDHSINTRNERPLLVEQKCNTVRCYNAPHSYLTRLVNQNQARIKSSKK